MNNSSVIVIFRKDNLVVEAYSSIKGFCEHNPGYNAPEIYRNHFRKGSDGFEDEALILRRVPFFSRKKHLINP